ncbi:MAG: amino acid adenylation domain-containing protein, partial [Micrococcales bacterium]|nr:amino acid adenylation domain-containing protein [Micrococcales bacterium]
MTPTTNEPPTDELPARLDNLSADRCDLDVLLRDEWRHRIAVRDDGTARATARHRGTIKVARPAAPVTGAARDAASSAALSLAAFHTALAAFGHGSTTVVVFVDQTDGSCRDDAQMWPTVVDHAQTGDTTCGVVAARLDAALHDGRPRRQADGLFGRGLFDAALMLVTGEIPEAAVPPVPLVAVVHDDVEAGCLRWTIIYACDLFDDAVIGGVLDVVREVFNQYATQPERPVREIEFLPDEQRRQLAAWNRTDGDFPSHLRLEDLFEVSARHRPDSEAVVFRDERLTYAELNERSNQLAHLLIDPSVAVEPGALVGLYLDKSHHGVAATLAIWKAGAAYVPIDPTYPGGRVRRTIEETSPTAIITNRRHEAGLREILVTLGSSAVPVVIESVLAPGGAATSMPRWNPSPEVSSGDLAYVTYTSGTTGVPKGVPKQHRSVVNSITDLSQRYDMRTPGQERVALFASYVFEPHLRQTLLALINGQTLVVVPDEVRLDPDRLPFYLAEHGVTYLNATGSVLCHFDLSRCPELRSVALVGEELTSAGLRQLRERFSGRIINEYAFTEAAFVTAIKEFAPGTVKRTDRSIGRPLRNVRCHVLSQQRKELPIGAIGELYIGGCGVAVGYLGQDELTRSAFFPDPFGQDERGDGQEAHIYRTGDLARVLPDGEIEYLGRADFQVKINGVRVEPGEIEALATEHPRVQQCVVVAREASDRFGDRYLVGYYVVQPGAELSEAELLAYLEGRLIQVMVPARMISLDRIPLNINGKVDRSALPPPDLGVRAPVVSDDTDRQGSLARALREIWSEVLCVPSTGISSGDDFFHLGGHSISCVLVVALIRRRLRRAILIEDVFRLRTLERLTTYLARCPEFDPHHAEPGADGVADADSPTANGLQQSLLYHALRREDGDDAYVVQSVYRYHTQIRPDLMEQAWRLAHRTFPSLRLRFDVADEPRQVIEPEDVGLDWRQVDASDPVSDHEHEAVVARLLEEDRTERYDPTAGRLARVYLLEHAHAATVIFSCHHIVIDGWSLPVLHEEVHRAYIALADGQAIEPRHDSAYLAAQRYWKEHRHDHVAYWTGVIERIHERGDYSGLLNAASRSAVALPSYDRVLKRRSRCLRLGSELTAAVAAACAANHVTMHSVLQFVWHEVLHAVGGGRSTVVGTIVSGRNLPIDGIESSVGLFINTLPLVVDHAGRKDRHVATAIADIQSAVATMNEKSVVEFGRLQGGTMKRQLFDSLLVLESYPRLLDGVGDAACRQLLRYERFFDADRVDHPLAVVGREEDGDLTVTLWYAAEILEEGTVDGLLEITRTLFEQVACDMDRPVTDLELLSPRMIDRFDAWNQTTFDFPADSTLSQLFEERAKEWPDQTAVVFNDRTLTYRQLDETANRLAHHLRALALLRADDLIALVMDKSEWMIVAIIAVWKAGAAYVPIDPAAPDDRVAFMLEDTNARLVVADGAHTSRLQGLAPDAPRPVVALDELDLAGESCTKPSTDTTSTDLAYAIYTSGTTGRPKAVMVEHRGVVNLQTSLARLFGLDRHDGDEGVLSFSNYVFDHFVEVLTDALLNGQKLVLLDDRMRTDQAGLCRYMNQHGVTYLSGTPSVLSLYDFSAATTLRRIDAIGEDFTKPVFDKVRATFPGGVIVNGYGPTEISITSHKRLYSRAEPRRNKSIGFPVANTTCYVLNDAMQRVPIGGVGELYIGGTGVTRGYLNRPDLTAERFIQNPFRTRDDEREGRNARLYRTGDVARWLPNAEIEYLGRTDHQVKIRGQRVELGEIESVLASCPGVERALVVARDHRSTAASLAAEKYLIGFYLGTEELGESDIKARMRSTLPDSLVPARIVRIEELPVTASGKLDTGRLPEVDFIDEAPGAFVAPSTDVEMRLCGLWSQVLGIASERIGVDDDFFALGGDSIRAMTLAQALASMFDREADVATVFEDTSIAAQARRLEAASAAPGNRIFPKPAAADKPRVSPAQERLLFIDDLEGGSPAYNVPFSLRVEAAAPADIAAGVRTLVRRHAALRTLLRPGDDGLYRQHVLDARAADTRFEVEMLTVESLAELDRLLANREQRVFRLGEDLPLDAAVVTVAAAPRHSYLSLVFHHTSVDGWSWNILRRELAAVLGGSTQAELPPIGATYADFATDQRRRLAGRRRTRLVEFWTGSLAGFKRVDLPLDHPRPPRFDYRGREVHFGLDGETAENIRALARSERVSVYSILLGAWCLMLGECTGQDDIVVATPSANRGRPEYNGIVGLVANLLTVRVRADRSATLSGYLRHVGAAVLAAQVHAELPFEQLITELNVERDPSRHPIVQVNFSLLSDTDAAGEGALLSEYAPREPGATNVKFDLSAMLRDGPTGITGTVTYAESLFDEPRVRGFVDGFVHTLTQFAAGSGDGDPLSVGDVSPLGDPDRAARDQRATGSPTDDAEAIQSLAALFERAVDAWPDHVAVACGGRHLTYSELNERANVLARHLRATTPLRGRDLVALVLDRSESTIAAILAVWKAGVGYLPIDPGDPDDRIRFMLQDTNARLVLTDDARRHRMSDIAGDRGPDVVTIDSASLGGYRFDDLGLVTAETDLAYAIYTSGTTGRPKATLVTQRNVLGFHRCLDRLFDGWRPEAAESVLLLANYVFDFSVEQIVLSVLRGNKLVVPPVELGPDAYADLVREELTYVSGTPTQIHQLDLARFEHLRAVLVAGEPFLQHHFEGIRRGYRGPVYTAYGTTETTVYNTVRRFDLGQGYLNDIGEPLGNTQLHVLDESSRPVTVGAVGEIHIAGECVTDGYLNRLDLSVGRFVPNHLQTDDQRRDGRCCVLYRTGDLARRGYDGELSFLGRTDAQVKVRGLRIEPGEVEAAIMAAAGVRECTVVAREDGGSGGEKHLVAYYVPEPGARVDDDTVVAVMRGRLAPGMVPSLVVRIEGQLPMTVSGKLDIDALAGRELVGGPSPYAAPGNRLEARLCRLWAEQLPVGVVGVDDDFFRSGGDSIRALRLATRVQLETGQAISVKDVFEFPTVRSFAGNALDGSGGGDGKTSAGGDPDGAGDDPPAGSCPLLPIQRWFFAKNLTD